MNIIVKLPVEIPEETINELAKRAAEELVNDERDLVAVVRCEDCRHFDRSLAICEFHGDLVCPDDYCSRGIKKEREK